MQIGQRHIHDAHESRLLHGAIGLLVELLEILFAALGSNGADEATARLQLFDELHTKCDIYICFFYRGILNRRGLPQGEYLERLLPHEWRRTVPFRGSPDDRRPLCAGISNMK